MCDCGFEHQRVFLAKMQYTVYHFVENRKVPPTIWFKDEMLVCLACGQISDFVPDAQLEELRQRGGESIAS